VRNSSDSRLVNLGFLIRRPLISRQLDLEPYPVPQPTAGPLTASAYAPGTATVSPRGVLEFVPNVDGPVWPVTHEDSEAPAT
jgi:hypothetical protein